MATILHGTSLPPLPPSPSPRSSLGDDLDLEQVDEEQGPLLEGLLQDGAARRGSIDGVTEGADELGVLRRRGGGVGAGIANMSVRLLLPRALSYMEEVMVNAQNAILGAGIIGELSTRSASVSTMLAECALTGLPYAMKEAGLLAGLLLLIGLGVVTDWTIRLIVLNAKLSGSSSYVGCARPLTPAYDTLVGLRWIAQHYGYRLWFAGSCSLFAISVRVCFWCASGFLLYWDDY